MDKKKFLISYLEKIGEKNVAREFIEFKGSSGALVILYKKKIYKITDNKTYLKEKKTINNLSDKLRSLFTKIFPDFEFIDTPDKPYGIIVFEYFGRFNYEEIILGAIKIDDIKYENIILSANNKILDLLDILHKKTSFDGSEKEITELIKHVVEIIKLNLANANLWTEKWKLEINKLEKICTKQSLVLSQSHNDLSVGNIFLLNNPNKVSIKLIDPRPSIPQSTRIMPTGNLAIDLLGYEISITRKLFEVKEQDKKNTLNDALKEIQNQKQYYINQKVFTVEFGKLVKIAFLSSYLACKCEYCLAKERIDLYNYMNELIQNIQGGLE